MRPSVYWLEFEARFKGKYRVVSATLGYETFKSKAAYGSVIFTLSPVVKLLSVNVMFGF